MNLETHYKEPRIYAFTLESRPGWIKVGYTDRQTVAERVKQETQVLNVRYRIEVDEKAQTDDGRMFGDNAVFRVLEEKMGVLRDSRVDSSSGKKRGKRPEWFKTDAGHVNLAIKMLQRMTAGASDAAKADFAMRPEQARAVEMTAEYFLAHPKVRGGQPPSFLWNAKMRFGKTFAAYQVAKTMGWKRILVMTFKPAVKDSWQHDLESHKDFAGWKFVSGGGRIDPRCDAPVVLFGSFQDFLQLDSRTGDYKARNKEAFKIEWDCVIVDEYHNASSSSKGSLL